MVTNISSNLVFVFGAILVAATAAPAQAASTIIAAPIGTALNPTLVIFNGFTTVAGGTTTGATGLKSNNLLTGFDGQYLQVKGGNNNTAGTFTQVFATSAQAFSFVFRSLPTTGATLTLNFVGGTSEAIDLGTAAGGVAAGRFTIHRNGGTNPSISSAVFTAANANSAYNIDSLASAAPEPAAWGLLIIGFGMAGATLRRRSDVSVES